jgi:hypothetical protein
MPTSFFWHPLFCPSVFFLKLDKFDNARSEQSRLSCFFHSSSISRSSPHSFFYTHPITKPALKIKKPTRPNHTNPSIYTPHHRPTHLLTITNQPNKQTNTLPLFYQRCNHALRTSSSVTLFTPRPATAVAAFKDDVKFTFASPCAMEEVVEEEEEGELWW